MKITVKQYGAWVAMRKGLGPSFNDEYNRQAFGMDRATFKRIEIAAFEARGLEAGRATLAEINNALKNNNLA